MDTSNLDLLRFKKVAREDYYTNDWKITPDEEKFAEELDKFSSYERHNQCHEHANQNKKEGSEAWNLWACYYRERYLKALEGVNELYKTGKQLKSWNERANSALIINFQDGLKINEDEEYLLENLKCNNFFFPFKVKFDQLKVLGRANFMHSTFSDVADFRLVIFSDNVNFSNAVFSGRVNFNSATFSGRTHFNSTTFSDRALFGETTFLDWAQFKDAIFSDYAYFSSTTVSGFVDFRSVVFCGKAHFPSATFCNRCDFSEVKFSDNAIFQSTKFSGRTDFNSTTFDGTADFLSTTFSGKTSFLSTSFSNHTDYTYAIFSDTAEFSSTSFLGEVLFKSATFKASSRITGCTFSNNLNFTDVTVNRAFDFSESTFQGVNDFTGTKFEGAAIFNVCNFKLNDNVSDAAHKSNSTAPNFTATIFEIPPNLSYLSLPEPEDINEKMAAAKFRRLKELAEDGKNHLAEARFFRYEMLCRRGYEESKLFSFFITLYDKISRFSLSVTRPFVALIGFMILFWGIYVVLRTGLNIDQLKMAPIGDLLLYSAHNALPLIGANSDQKLALVNTLFGGYESRPIYFGIASFFQNLIGLGLYFLILLAIRSYFRMR